jgi:methionine-rich copper-binding protein CopC
MKLPHQSSLAQDVLRACLMTAIAVAVILVPRVASAHAVLVQSSPAANSTLHGPDVPISIRYNSRVDGSRSSLSLVSPDGQAKSLMLEKQSSPDTLTAKATGLASGKYVIHWQVLAPDGHITRGQIPFTVQ